MALSIFIHNLSWDMQKIEILKVKCHVDIAAADAITNMSICLVVVFETNYLRTSVTLYFLVNDKYC